MLAEHWKQVEELFDRGLEASESDREALVAGVDRTIADGVRALWRQLAEAGSFLCEPVVSLDHAGVFHEGRLVADRFTVLSFVGAGGMGEVYVARDTRLGRTVALKALNAELASRPEARLRLEREAHAVCSLQHPSICTLYDLEWEGEIPFLVMEHLTGETLAARLKRSRPPLDELLRIADAIAGALYYAHGRGVVHRDLKPGNVMLGDFGVKLLDFGIAKRAAVAGQEASLVTTEKMLTSEGAIVGTAAYMSPEQAEGKPVDQRSDIFSFGALLYEMATGQRAFQGDTQMSTLAAILQRDPAAVRLLVPASPRALDRVVTRCLRKRPDERYASMAEVRQALSAIGHPRKRMLVLAGLGAVAAAAALAGFVALRSQQSKLGAPPPLSRPVQLTRDRGVSGYPSLSPDGTWVAYTSNRGGQNGVWIQRVDGTAARRIAECSEVEDPVFRPNSDEVIFGCKQDRQWGLYSVSLADDRNRMIATAGRGPSVSPDGKWVVYQPEGFYHHFVKLIDGGEPVNVTPAWLLSGGRAVWSPDGQYVLLYAMKDRNSKDADFWLVPRARGEPVRTRIFERLVQAGHVIDARASPFPFAWTGNRIYFSSESVGVRDVWRVRFDHMRLEPVSAPEALTAGANAGYGSVAGKLLAFDTTTSISNLEAVPLSPDGRRTFGSTRSLTSDAAVNFNAELSADATQLVYQSTRAGRVQIFRFKLQSGDNEWIADSIPTGVRLNSDNSKIAWTDSIGGQRRVLFVHSRGEPKPVRVCEDCGFPAGWLADSSGLIVWGHPERDSLYKVDLVTGKKTLILQDPGASLAAARLSPDARWVVFGSLPASGYRRRTYIAPITTGSRLERENWIPVAAGETAMDWSFDANWLYWYDEPPNGRVVYGVPLDPKSKYPTRPSVEVYRLPSESDGFLWGLAAGRGLLVVSVARSHGNVFLQKLPD